MMKHLRILSAVALLAISLSPTLVLAQGEVENEELTDAQVEELVQNSTGNIDAITPALNVSIPGVNLENSVIIGEGRDKNGCDVGYICVRTLDTYLNGLYKWGAGVAIMFAIVLIMVSGIQWMVGAAVGSIEQAKKRILNATLGLGLVFFTSALLTFINPSITQLNGLPVKVLQPAEDLSSETVLGSANGVGFNPDPENFTGDFATANLRTSGQLVRKDIVDELQTVADVVEQRTGLGVTLSSGWRTPQKQASLWLDNCSRSGNQVSRCSPATCNPFPREAAESPFTATNQQSGPWEIKQSVMDDYPTTSELNEYLISVAAENPIVYCPHLAGTVVDIWCTDGIGSYTDDADCHYILEEAMREEGFRRLGIEGWHFEFHTDGYRAISASARSGNWGPGVIQLRGGGTFDYGPCRESQGGSGYVNLKSNCCSNNQGVCVDP